jgi:multiple sugar transport system ATP-binding protein
MSEVEARGLEVRYGNFTALAELDLKVAPGQFLVLLGPSGCGKSTLLNAVAGLQDVTRGQVWIGGRNVTWAEPRDRGIAMVFQSYALYPKMSVRQNLSFGLKVAGMPAEEIDRRVRAAAETLQLGSMLERRPAELSGGQRQRVAIGRVLVRQAKVFLFDEPLSNLDAQLRVELRREIKRLHRQLGSTSIYVTHDQVEAMTLADTIAVMNKGRIEQLGSPEDIYGRPASRYVAGFVGSPAMNFLEGTLESANGAPVFRSGGRDVPLHRYQFNAGTLADGRKALLGMRPEHAVLGDAAAGSDFDETCSIDMVEKMGSDTLAWCVTPSGHQLSVRADAEARLQDGASLRVGLPAARMSLFDASSGVRL